MKHYRDEQGRIFGVEPDGSQDHLIKDDWVACAAPVAPAADPADVAKALHAAELRSLVHDFGDGRVIQVRPPETGSMDESNIRNAIERLTRTAEADEMWYMADNNFHRVTAAELQEALNSGQDQAKQAWDDLRAAIQGG